MCLVHIRIPVPSTRVTPVSSALVLQGLHFKTEIMEQGNSEGTERVWKPAVSSKAIQHK